MVEDDAIITEFLGKYFAEGEFVLTAVVKPSQGLNAIKKEQFDIIILDLTLPGIDGLELCKQLNSLTTTPIIISSARSDINDKLVALEHGADDYLEKPYDPRELEARIKTVLKMSTYTFNVANLTAGQPMSPVLVSSNSLFSVGESVSICLEKLAEGGDNSELLDANGVSGTGLLTPGSSETLSMATMLVKTNDASGIEGFSATRDDSDKVTLHSGVITKDDGLSSSALSAFEKWNNPAAAVTITRTK